MAEAPASNLGGGFDAQAAARAGNLQGLSLFFPGFRTGQGMDLNAPAGGFDFNAMKQGFADQRALADTVRGSGFQDTSGNTKKMSQKFAGANPTEEYSKSTINQDAPWNYVPQADLSGGLGFDPKTGLGFDPSQSPAGYNRDTSGEPINYYRGALGIDPGLEGYEEAWKKSVDPNTYRTAEGISDWQKYSQAANMKTLLDWEAANMKPEDQGHILHSITDPDSVYSKLDPYGYGTDYVRFIASQLGGEEGYNKEVQRYIDLAPTERSGYESRYGKMPVGDPVAMESWFRRARAGGDWTKNAQDWAAQNARTEMTEGAIMAALMAGMGALAAPASIGYGGTYGASNAWGSTLANQFTADALARSAISGAGQYG